MIKSEYKNVYWHPGISKWTAKVKVNYKSHHLGCFLSESDANEAVVKFKVANRMIGENGCQPSIMESFKYDNGNLLAEYRSQNYSVGDVVGSKCKTHGYIMVGHNGKLYTAHRIVWQMFKGSVPAGMEIDHINGDRADNRIENLRVVTRKENTMNRRLSSNNKTGIHGVKVVANYGYEASIGGGGSRYYLGKFNDFFEACCARKSAELAYGYHENHGKVSTL